MSVKYFVDTNVLVYAFDNTESEKQRIALEILEKHGNTGELTISTQVLQEFFVTVTRKLKPAMDVEVAQQLVQSFSRYPVVQVTPYLIQAAIERYRRESFSFWDSLVVEAAIFGDCGGLLSEDMQDGREIGTLVIQNPFSPGSTLD